jgi:hypothetical protein
VPKNTETTISVNGGPEVPLDVAMAAVDAIIDAKSERVMQIVEGALAKPKTETRQLMCRLTDDEQRCRGVDLADHQKKLAELTEKKRELGDQIKDCQAKIDRLAETVKHRQEERPVTCLLTPDYTADSMTVTRTDSGEIVAIRQLTHAERQPELPMDAKK